MNDGTSANLPTSELMEAENKRLTNRRERILAAFEAVKATLLENKITLSEWNEVETMINQETMAFVGDLRVSAILTK